MPINDNTGRVMYMQARDHAAKRAIAKSETVDIVGFDSLPLAERNKHIADALAVMIEEDHGNYQVWEDLAKSKGIPITEPLRAAIDNVKAGNIN